MIALARPDLGQEEIDAAVSALRSGNLVQGERVEAFECGLAARLGRRHAIVVASGTAALHLAMLALGIGPGDEVIVPAFTFPATANAVELVGAVPVLCDIDPQTCNLDPDLVRPLITNRTRALMPVHEFGRPADMDRLCAIAREHGLHLVEDAACAIGAQWRGRPCGAFGVLACFSFHPRKVLTTGEGGAILTDDDALADRLRLLRNHGIRRNGAEIDFVCAGYNYRLTEIQAAIGSVQLRRLDAMIAGRRAMADGYRRCLDGTDCVLPTDPPEGLSTYQTYHILLPTRERRRDAAARLQSASIACGNGATALALTSHHRRFAGTRPLPGAERAFHCGLALPLLPGLTGEDQQRIAACIGEVS